MKKIQTEPNENTLANSLHVIEHSYITLEEYFKLFSICKSDIFLSFINDDCDKIAYIHIKKEDIASYQNAGEFILNKIPVRYHHCKLLKYETLCITLYLTFLYVEEDKNDNKIPLPTFISQSEQYPLTQRMDEINNISLSKYLNYHACTGDFQISIEIINKDLKQIYKSNIGIGKASVTRFSRLGRHIKKLFPQDYLSCQVINVERDDKEFKIQALYDIKANIINCCY
jgi:hypothetical protein